MKNFIYIKYVSYIFFIISFSVKLYAPKYLEELNIILKTIICGFLLYRFNPWNTIILTEFDRKIIFDSALYLLFSTLLIDFYLLIKKYYAVKNYKNIYKKN